MLDVATVGLGPDMARALDPVMLMADCGLEADDWQAKFLRSQARRRILNCSRQAGKSTVSAALALWHALYDPPGSLVLLVSPSQRQSGELFKRVTTMLSTLPGAPKPEMESLLRLEFPTGNRIVSLPGSSNTTRGYSAASLVVIDEASRCPDELIEAIRPTQVTLSDSRLVVLSTPWGRQGFFHRTWSEAVGWEKTELTWKQCPRIDAEAVAEFRAEMGETLYEQEYLARFVDIDEQMFSSELIAAAFSEEVRPLW